MEAVEPVAHRRALAERDDGRDILEPDEVERRIADDPVDLVSRQEVLVADEGGHRSRARAGRSAPQALDRVQSRGGACLDQHDESQAPLREAADFARMVGDAQPLCRH